MNNSCKTIHTFANEYRNLMQLLVNHLYLDDFGECRGMGRCCTCVVKIESSQPLSEFSSNEKRTLTRHDYNPDEVRLACQIPINNQLHLTTVTII
ncbi:MAG: 2Fe-2S iron-sulfur cluster-binding protein [Bacteroidia bacterium]